MGWSSECIPRQVWKTSTSGESGLERADNGLFNQPVCSFLGVYLAFPRRELYEYNKYAHLEWIAKDLENNVPPRWRHSLLHSRISGRQLYIGAAHDEIRVLWYQTSDSKARPIAK